MPTPIENIRRHIGLWESHRYDSFQSEPKNKIPSKPTRQGRVLAEAQRLETLHGKMRVKARDRRLAKERVARHKQHEANRIQLLQIIFNLMQLSSIGIAKMRESSQKTENQQYSEPNNQKLPTEFLVEPDAAALHKNQTNEWRPTNCKQLFPPNGPEWGNIKQGKLGDCFVLCNLAPLVPKLSSMIQFDGQGFAKAKFFAPDPSNETAPWKPVWISVSDRLLFNKITNRTYYAQLTDVNRDGLYECGVPLIEKALALYNDRYEFFGPRSGYGGIGHGGYPYRAYKVLTGEDAHSTEISTLTNAQLLKTLQKADQGSVVTTASLRGGPSIIVGGHCYSVLGTGRNGRNESTVILRNPWGRMGHGSKKKDDDGIITVPLSVFRLAFISVFHPS